MSVCCVSCFVVCCCVCAVLCYVLVCWCWCGVLLRVCACYVIWLCGVCFVCCCRPSGALGLLGHNGAAYRNLASACRASRLCPVTPPTLVRLDRRPALASLTDASASGEAQRHRWTGARSLLAASRPLPPETSPTSAGTRTWTPQECDASTPSSSQDTTSRSPPRPAGLPACRQHRRRISAAADGRL